MLKNSFIFLEGIGKVRERRLWEQGILRWEDFLEEREVRGISAQRKELYNRRLKEASYMAENEREKFAYLMPSGEQWRLFWELEGDACYLDIETTGLGECAKVTAVSVHSSKGTSTFVRGINLDSNALEEELRSHAMVVTFYGSAFDLPFLRREFQVSIPPAHVDLCFAGRRAGLSGGLKSIEKNLGIGREEELEGVDGLEAVRLWKRWEREKDTSALEKLITYNRADVENLPILAGEVCTRLREKCFLPYVGD